MNFLPKYVHFYGQIFSDVFEQFSFTSKLLWLKMLASIFQKKIVLRAAFIKLMSRWLQTGLSDLKKTPNN